MKPYHKNPRKITTKQADNLRDWLAELGDLSGIVHDLNTDEIIGGNQRGMVFDVNKCAVELIDGPHEPDEQGTVAHGFIVWKGARYAYRQVRWDDKQAEKANIVANKAGGGWDFDTLANEFEVSDLIEWGFDAAELGIDLTGGTDDAAEPQIDRAEELREQWGVEPGQLWRLPSRTPGQYHALICGDCTDAAVVGRVMGGEVINIAFTSPPYAEQRDYDESSGFRPIPPDKYVEWWNGVQSNVANHMASDGSFFVNIKPGAENLDTYLYVIDLVVSMVREWGWHFATEFCWERTGVPKKVSLRFKNQFEPVYQFARGRWKIRPESVQHWSDSVPRPGGKGVGETNWAKSQGGNGAMFGAAKKQKGGSMSNVQGTSVQPGDYIGPGMAYPGNRLPTFAGTHEATGHTAAFPVGLPEFFIKAYSDSGDIVYEPFSGSGTTIIAAENKARQARAVEISPAYVAVALQRYVDAFGIEPELVT